MQTFEGVLEGRSRPAGTSILLLVGLGLQTVWSWGMRPARATEFAGTHASLGFSEALSGWPLQPGFYIRGDLTYRDYRTLADQSGDPVQVHLGPLGKIPLKYYQNVHAATATLFYVLPDKLPYLDATFGFGVYQAYAISRREAQISLGQTVSGSAETRRGFSDTFFVPAYFGWRIPGLPLGVVLLPFNVVAATGQYTPNDPIGNTIGRNYWSYRPEINVTFLNSTGQEASINLAYVMNSQNPATHYLSGQEFYFNYALTQHLSSGLSPGVSGYYYKQVTNDRRFGQTVNAAPGSSGLLDPLNTGPGNRGEVFSIGPNILYRPSSSLFFNFHWNHEVFGYNRPVGDVFYLRAAYRF